MSTVVFCLVFCVPIESHGHIIAVYTRSHFDSLSLDCDIHCSATPQSDEARRTTGEREFDQF